MSVWAAQVWIYGDQYGMIPACVILWGLYAHPIYFLVNLFGQQTCIKVHLKKKKIRMGKCVLI